MFSWRGYYNNVDTITVQILTVEWIFVLRHHKHICTQVDLWTA